MDTPRCAVILCALSWCAPSPSHSPALGAYVGNDPPELGQFEDWLGKPVDFVAAHSGRANWSDWLGSIDWLLTRWNPIDKPISWTIPLFADGGSLTEAASGSYRTYYERAAGILAHSRPQDPVIYVRIGEEFNGRWMPWSAANREKDFVQAYRQFVDTFRSVSDRFRFEWNVNVGATDMDAANAYPGDGYVAVIGMDFYYHHQWDPVWAVSAWDRMVARPYGLQWLEDFAARHHKPTAYPEWGVDADTTGLYVKRVANWFSFHDVLYQAIWNVDDPTYRGKLSAGQYPNAAEAYRTSFTAARAHDWQFPPDEH
jgi:Glycosyl hydrolase family 26